MSLRPISQVAAPNPNVANFIVLSRSLMVSRGDLLNAQSLLEGWRAPIKGVVKAAVDAGGLSWGTELQDAEYTTAISGFLASLRNIGAFDALLPDMLTVPPQIKHTSVGFLPRDFVRIEGGGYIIHVLGTDRGFTCNYTREHLRRHHDNSVNSMMNDPRDQFVADTLERAVCIFEALAGEVQRLGADVHLMRADFYRSAP